MGRTYYLHLDSTDPTGNVTSAEASIFLEQQLTPPAPQNPAPKLYLAPILRGKSSPQARYCSSLTSVGHGVPRQGLRCSGKEDSACQTRRWYEAEAWHRCQRLRQEALIAGQGPSRLPTAAVFRVGTRADMRNSRKPETGSRTSPATHVAGKQGRREHSCAGDGRRLRNW